jgi:hypothetical protein
VKQFVAEQLRTVKDRRGFARQEWAKLRERNEALDCAVLARAALWLLGADRHGERFWARLREDVVNAPLVAPPAPSSLPELARSRHSRPLRPTSFAPAAGSPRAAAGYASGERPPIHKLPRKDAITRRLAISLLMSVRARFRYVGSCVMSDTADTAHVLIRPPIAWALAVIAGVAFDRLMPLPFMPSAVPAGWIGGAAFVAALALVAWAIATITQAGSNVPTNMPTTAIVESGPYRLTRNRAAITAAGRSRTRRRSCACRRKACLTSEPSDEGPP